VTTFNGLPAHVLLVHFVVVLAPLTAFLAILCAVWAPARKRLVWLVFSLAITTVALTPMTTDAGEWLQHQVGRSPQLHAHTELGDTMIYFAIALAIASALLVIIHVRQTRGHAVTPAVTAIVAAVVIVASTATVVQVYRIGDSGARASWGDQTNQSAN